MNKKHLIGIVFGGACAASSAGGCTFDADIGIDTQAGVGGSGDVGGCVGSVGGFGQGGVAGGFGVGGFGQGGVAGGFGAGGFGQGGVAGGFGAGGFGQGGSAGGFGAGGFGQGGAAGSGGFGQGGSAMSGGGGSGGSAAGTFNCGELQCDAASTFCQVLLPGVQGSGAIYSCKPIPVDCSSDLTCDCMEPFVCEDPCGNGGGCAESCSLGADGSITGTCALP